MEDRILKMPGNPKKYAPPGRVFTLPGRGVLRFSGQAYRNPVQILAIFRVFSKNWQI